MAQAPAPKTKLTHEDIKIDEVREGFVVLARTGGRDFQIIAVTESEVTANRLADGKSTAAGPYIVEDVPILIVNGMAFSRVQLQRPTQADEIVQQTRKRREVVVKKALALGLTIEEIALL